MAIDDTALWSLFRTASLPDSEWTHRGHLRVAWMFLQRHDLDEAHLLMRVGIIRLNASHDLIETAARGYHETLTRTWLALVARSMGGPVVSATSSSFVDAHSGALAKEAPLRHYSRERLFSLEARARFVDPDIEPIR
jgi:ribulose kinase